MSSHLTCGCSAPLSAALLAAVLVTGPGTALAFTTVTGGPMVVQVDMASNAFLYNSHAASAVTIHQYWLASTTSRLTGNSWISLADQGFGWTENNYASWDINEATFGAGFTLDPGQRQHIGSVVDRDDVAAVTFSYLRRNIALYNSQVEAVGGFYDPTLPGQNVSRDFYGGGQGDQDGGVTIDFDIVSGEGTLAVEYKDGITYQEFVDMFDGVDPYDPGTLRMWGPDDTMQVWMIDFDGTFNSAELTVHYNDTGMTLEEEAGLGLWHRDSVTGGYKFLDVLARNADENWLTVRAEGFSPFVIGSLPEPATASLLLIGGLAALRRRRR